MTTFLASFPSPPQGVWHLGWLPIRAYALFIIIGIVVALIIGDRRWAARGGEPGVIYDIALWAVPFGLIGGRLYHVMTDWETYFGENGAGFVAALKIWDGGLGIWGAVALGAVGAWIGCRRRGIPLPAFGDAIAPGIILAQAIGRLGNYFNQELYGRPTSMPWGLEIYDRRDPSGLIDPHSLDGVSTGHVVAVVQPTFLYELLWNVLVFVALIYLDRWLKLGHGRLFATYVAGYCIGRFWVELLRDDHATHIAGIRINSFTSTLVFIGAVVYIVLAPKGREDPATLAGKPHKPKEQPKKVDVAPKAPKQPVKAEDSALMEWTKELAAVAATSGVVAGVAVAAEHDEDESTGGEAKTEAEPQEASEEGHAEDLTPDVEPEDAEAESEEPVMDEAVEDEPAANELPEEAQPSDDVAEATDAEAAAEEESQKTVGTDSTEPEREFDAAEAHGEAETPESSNEDDTSAVEPDTADESERSSHAEAEDSGADAETEDADAETEATEPEDSTRDTVDETDEGETDETPDASEGSTSAEPEAVEHESSDDEGRSEDSGEDAGEAASAEASTDDDAAAGEGDGEAPEESTSAEPDTVQQDDEDEGASEESIEEPAGDVASGTPTAEDKAESPEQVKDPAPQSAGGRVGTRLRQGLLSRLRRGRDSTP